MVTIIFWSLAYVFTRITLKYFSAFSLGFLRYFVAAAVMAVLAVRLRIKPPPRKDLIWFLLAGLTGFFLYIIAFNKGCQTVTAAESSVLMATVPAITALLAKLIYQEKIHSFQYPAVALEFTGVVVLVEAYKTFRVNPGLLWLLGAAFLLSVYNILQRKLTREYSPLRTVMYSIFAGGILLFVFAPGALAEAKDAPPAQFLYIAALGVFSSAAAYFSWATALARAKETSSVSNYMFLTPLLATLLGYWLLQEKPLDSTLGGGALILTGMAVFNFGEAIMAFLRRLIRS